MLQHVCYGRALSLVMPPGDVAACLLWPRPGTGDDTGLCCSMFVMAAPCRWRCRRAMLQREERAQEETMPSAAICG
jgi:hypothetical protein